MLERIREFLKTVPPWVWEVLLVLLLLLLLFLLLRLLLRTLSKRRKRKKQAQTAATGNAQGDAEQRQPTQSTGRAQSAEQQKPAGKESSNEKPAPKKSAEQLRKEALLTQVLTGDPDVAKALLEQADAARYSAHQVLHDPDLTEQVARELNEKALEVFRAAAQSDISFNLQRTSERVPVNYPTNDVEPTQITDLGQLVELYPEQLLLSPTEFSRRLATDELTRPQYYEDRVSQKLMYICMDVSGSMKEEMSSGKPRHVWARGVAINLLLKAVKGEAAYFLRNFSDHVEELQSIATPEEATKLVAVLSSQYQADGGTNIGKVLNTAIEDIRTEGGQASRSEILLITDCEDEHLSDAETLKERLGTDVHLHVVKVGGNANSGLDTLRAVATSFREIA